MLLMQRSGKLVDLVNTSAIWTPVNGATSALTQSGISSRFDGTTSRVFQSADYPHMGGATGTFFVWMPRFGVYDLGVNCIFLSTTSASSYLQLVSDGRVYVGATFGTGAPNLANSRNRSVVFSARSGSTDVYFDGIRRVQGIGNALINSEPKTLNFGGYSGGTEWDLDADIVIAGYSSTPWGEAECKAFHDNPWQLFYKKVNTPLDVTIRENRKPILRESTLLGTSKRKLSDVNVLVGNSINKRLTKQPQEWADPAPSFLSGLQGEFLWLPQMGGTPTLGSGATQTRVVSPVGAAIDFTGGSIGALNQLAVGSVAAETIAAYTFALVITRASAPTPYSQFAVASSAGADSQRPVLMLVDPGSTNLLGVITSAGGVASTGLLFDAFGADPQCLVVSMIGGQKLTAVQRNLRTGAVNTFDGPLGGGAWSLQAGNAVVGGRAYGQYAMQANLRRYFSLPEAMALSANPWQLFKNQSQLILPK
jgi:hypothetical protein